MGKLSLAGTSLVAAIPGGVLAYLMLMAVLNNLESMPTILKVSTISLLVVAGLITLFPFFILVYGPKSANAEKPAKKEPKSTQTMPTSATGIGDEGEVLIDDEDTDSDFGGQFDGDADSGFDGDGFDEEEENEGFELDDDEMFAGSLDETEGEMDASYDDEFEFDEFDDDDN